MSAHALAEPQAPADTQSLQVIKRNGTLVSFDASKISVAVTKAFLAVEGDQSAGSAHIHDAVQRVTAQVVDVEPYAVERTFPILARGLPEDERELKKLAYLLNYSDAGQLLRDCRRFTAENRRYFDQLFDRQ